MAPTQSAIDLFEATGAVPLSDAIRSLESLPALPVDWITFPEDMGFLDNVGILSVGTTEQPVFTTFQAVLIFAIEVTLGMPGLEGFSLVAGGTTPGGTQITLEMDLGPDRFELRIIGSVALRFARNILKPVTRGAGGWVDQPGQFSEIRIAGTIRVDGDGDVSIDGSPAFSLQPVMIADSGVVIQAQNVIPILSSKTGLPPGAPPEIVPGWRGLYIGQSTIYLPAGVDLPLQNLSFQNCYIGSGGFTGEVSTTWQADAPTGELFGLAFALSKIDIGFRQNALTQSEIIGRLRLPFFEQPVDVEIGLSLNGSFAVKLASMSGLYTLTKPGILDLQIESLGFQVRGGVFTTILSGQVTPLIGDLDWPSFQVRELAIDTKGNIRLNGGWLDLPNQYGLTFYGFQMEITKLGFGQTDDGSKWIGFSGGLRLVEGLPAGISVEGLRVVWYDDGRDPQITFNGVGVEFLVPNALRFKGAVSYRSALRRFDGVIQVNLIALDLNLDAALVIGSNNNSTYAAVYLNVDLPAGIPLWSTGLALYGMAGLYAIEMAPGRQPGEAWYENADGSAGWYKRPAEGVLDLSRKWDASPGGLALGAGVTVGTISDNGYLFSGKMVLVLVFPGPVLLIDGKANLLAQRSTLDSGDEPTFRALAVLDNRAGTLLIGLNARYQYYRSGELIDIRGNAEGFFDLNDASQWHVYLGEKTPREKRIRALVYSLLQADAYLMLDSNQLALGARAGFDRRWKFGPLRVALGAWIEGNAVISWKPSHYTGSLSLGGKAELRVFGFGVGLSVDATISADVFDPFHLLAKLRVGIDLPWFLPDFDVTLTLEWGPDPTPPLLPLPLQQIAVEHFKSKASWPLPRGSLLLPIYDGDGDSFIDDTDRDGTPDGPAGSNEPSDSTTLPVVPLDCRPHVTFSRNVNDDAGVGVNGLPVVPPWERIGDPANNEGPVQVRYGLQSINLQKQIGGNWVTVAQTPNPSGGPKLYGSWAPVPAMPDGGGVNVNQTKLWLWSKTAFDYTRRSGRSWDEWFTNRFRNYPCVPLPKETCYDFETVDLAQVLQPPWSLPTEPRLTFAWAAPISQGVTALGQQVEGRTRALCLPPDVSLPDGSVQPNWLVITLPRAAQIVSLIFADPKNIVAVGYDIQGNAYDSTWDGNPDNPRRQVMGQNIVRILVRGDGLQMCLVGLCIQVDDSRLDEMRRRLVEEMVRWQGTGNVLEPYTVYRLVVSTTASARGEGDLSGYSQDLVQTEYAYFRTEGPPGLAQLSVPANQPETASALDDLAVYVTQTVPATVPAAGQQPMLPRPVYRSYDIGVLFNENYVDLMYRMARRDLGLYLYDNNNQPARDIQGRLIALDNRWVRAAQVTLTDGEQRWIDLVNTRGCASFNPGTILRNRGLTSAAGQPLAADTLYEARLIPLLLREGFTSGLSGWQVINEGSNAGPASWGPRGHQKITGTTATATGTLVRLDGAPDLTALDPTADSLLLYDDTARPSQPYKIISFDNVAKTVSVDAAPNLANGSSTWEIPEWGAVVQTSNIWGGSPDSTNPAKPGTMLILASNPALPSGDPDQPGGWTDYLLSVYLRSMADGAIGLVCRYRDASSYYRFSMDRQAGYRRLVRVSRVTAPDPNLSPNTSLITSVAQTVLAEDQFDYSQNQDYLITIEANGPTLRVYQDGVLVFDVTDNAVPSGSVGLYCWRNPGARFGDVRVDDLRTGAPVAYRYKFTTSRFTDFFHHLHSYQDEVWVMESAPGQPPEAQIAGLIQAAVMPDAGAPAPAEDRACQALIGFLLGSARQNASQVQVTRVERNGQAFALLVQSPEPIDWKRTDLQVSFAPTMAPRPTLPGVVKLTGVTFGAGPRGQEVVTTLVRETTDLTGYRVDYRPIPGSAIDPAPPWAPYYRFGPAVQLPTGTRVQVAGGGAVDAPPGPTSTLRLANPPTDEPIELRLPATGVDLRIVANDGTTVHTRRFLPAGAYAPVDARALRTSDGTAFFVVVPQASALGSQLAAGQYRLTLTYRRDNRAADPSSQVFSEAGNVSPETAILDIPW